MPTVAVYDLSSSLTLTGRPKWNAYSCELVSGVLLSAAAAAAAEAEAEAEAEGDGADLAGDEGMRWDGGAKYCSNVMDGGGGAGRDGR